MRALNLASAASIALSVLRSAVGAVAGQENGGGLSVSRNFCNQHFGAATTVIYANRTHQPYSWRSPPFYSVPRAVGGLGAQAVTSKTFNVASRICSKVFLWWPNDTFSHPFESFSFFLQIYRRLIFEAVLSIMATVSRTAMTNVGLPKKVTCCPSPATSSYEMSSV